MIEHLDPDPKLGSGKKVTDPAHLVSTSHEASLGQFGHHYETQQRRAVFGVVYTTPDPPPITGAKTLHLNSQFNLKSDDSMHRDLRVPVSLVPLPSGALSNQEFPKFDGSNPRLWAKGAETYFDVFAIEPRMWVKIASMNLSGSTALWFHTLKNPIESRSWSDLVAAACLRFDKGENNHLLRTIICSDPSST
jgi:hypothetical protein